MGFGADPMSTRIMEELGGLWVASRPSSLPTCMRRSTDPQRSASPSFRRSRARSTSASSGRSGGSTDREHELELREAERRKADADRELAAVEKRAAGVKAGAR